MHLGLQSLLDYFVAEELNTFSLGYISRYKAISYVFVFYLQTMHNLYCFLASFLKR